MIDRRGMFVCGHCRVFVYDKTRLRGVDGESMVLCLSGDMCPGASNVVPTTPHNANGSQFQHIHTIDRTETCVAERSQHHTNATHTNNKNAMRCGHTRTYATPLKPTIASMRSCWYTEATSLYTYPTVMHYIYTTAAFIHEYSMYSDVAPDPDMVCMHSLY